MRNSVLITGCCGFIGSHLTDLFLNDGYDVFGIDNLLTGDTKNINHLSKNNRFKFFEHDICKKINLNNKFRYILHFASPASPMDYLRFPIKTLQIGSIGTENILELACKSNATILVASTSEVYGDPLEHPQKENYFGNVNPIGPRGVYDEAKRYLEALTMAYNRKFNLDVRIVRIFNTYGERMRINDGRAIPNFINQAIKNRNFTVYGDGSQTRSFSYINDTVNGIYKLIKSNYQLPVNIGNPVENSINELIELIKSMIKCDGKIVYYDLPENDPKVRKPDISLATKTLNWTPKISLKEGLYKTIRYFSNQ